VKLSSRVGALAIATAIGSAGFVLPVAESASAAVLPSVVCAKQFSPAPKPGQPVKSTLSQCTPAALAGGATSTSAVVKGQPTGTVTNTLVWKNGKGNTVTVVKFAYQKTSGKCANATDYRIKITGTVKNSSGAAAKIVKKGEPVSASICLVSKGAKTGQLTNEPGTKFKV
jgi:hypothetical protein